jgi:hypothetical protein
METIHHAPRRWFGVQMLHNIHKDIGNEDRISEEDWLFQTVNIDSKSNKI